MIYPRDILSELHRHIEARQATVITGIRRCGKTTLLRELLKKVTSENKLYIDLEIISNRLLFEELDYNNIITKLSEKLDFTKKVYLALDEIQFVKNLPSVVKYLYDHYDIKFFLTGSSSYYLKNLFTQSLAGRKAIFELYTLNFREYLRFREVKIHDEKSFDRKFHLVSYLRLKEHYNDFIKFGGFPEVVLAPSIERKNLILNDILDSYLKVDIQTLSDFESITDMYRFLKVIASRTGNKLDISKLSTDSGLSRQKVSNFIELFEGTYLLKRIPVFTKSPEREIKKTPKLYFHDTGLLNILAEVGSGVQFENSIFNQLKHFGEISYYQLKTGREIDFILKPSYPLFGQPRSTFEVKEHCGDFDAKRLNRLSDNLKIPERKLIFRYPPPKEGQMSEEYVWGGDIR